MNSKEIRVQKAIADRGLASRRQAEAMIEEGRVTVNGKVITLGDKCDPAKDQIVVDGNALPKRTPERRVIALNKPKGFVCTNHDPHADRTVFDLLPPEWVAERLFCVGRLDKESEGLIIITNDGDLNQKLAHPTYRVLKKYRAVLDKSFDPADTRKLLNGITWEGERLKVEKVIPYTGKGKETTGRLELHMEHGKKREIRRLLYALGYEVKKLQRFQIGSFTLHGLGKGKFKLLRRNEVERLFD